MPDGIFQNCHGEGDEESGLSGGLNLTCRISDLFIFFTKAFRVFDKRGFRLATLDCAVKLAGVVGGDSNFW